MADRKQPIYQVATNEAGTAGYETMQSIDPID
jgi:hypothetical protein